VALAPVADLRPVSGTYETRDQADARARIPGVLATLTVKEGNRVTKGQVIGFVRDERLGQQTAAFDAQSAAAAAEAGRAQADLVRTRDLYEHGVYAKARLEQVEAASRAATAQLAASKAQRAASLSLAGQGAILAPASGVVLHAPVPAGSVVMPGQSIATVTAGPPVVRLQLPEAQASALKTGASVLLKADDGATTSTTITQIYPSVTAGIVTVDLAAPAGAAGLIGRRIEARVPVGTRQAIQLPSRFITARYGVDYVRIVRRDGASSEVVVQTAAAAEPGKVEVLSGLAPGDVVAAPIAGAPR
jgi:RND family efflux transporter MFP subunit